jgi:ComF family protein
VRISDPMCQLCGRPFASPLAAQAMTPLCHLCRLNTYAFDRARSFAIYSDALFEAIILMKYEEVAALGRWFAERLSEIADFSQMGQPNLIVPVPLHPERRRERGYNQAELIAGPLAKRLGTALDPVLLFRARPRPPQLLLSRSQRWKSVRGAYATPPGRRVDNLCILLVDDVFTTGATLDACSRALKRAGASVVLALTVGRVVPAWLPPR